MYCTTPHTTTGTSPVQTLFHHIPNNGLPIIQPSKSTVSNREANYREQNKEYIDKKRFTKHKDFQIGEKVNDQKQTLKWTVFMNNTPTPLQKTTRTVLE